MGVEPETRRNAMDEIDTDFGVISRVSLADVVEQCPEDEKVRPSHPCCEASRLSSRLPQMPVDGEPVVRIALRTRTIRRPLRKHLHPETALVDSFQNGNRIVSTQQQTDEIIDGTCRPR
jgi:hypothetical protein